MDFLLFRLPQEPQFYCIKHQETGANLASFFPFDSGEVLHLNAENIQEISAEEIKVMLNEMPLPTYQMEIRFPQEEEYWEKIHQAIQSVEENHWQKLVISRPIDYSFHYLDLAQTFLALSEAYQNTLCYIWKDKERLWLGATPEVLGQYDERTHIFETMSLAGTLPKNEDWTDKEKEEQKAVTQYIKDILHRYTDEVKISEVSEQILGKIKHLKTDFTAKVPPQYIDELIQNLHPTPAVCGFPKEECKSRILAIEDYPREYYTGYIRIELWGRAYFFVNLRCVQLFQNKAVLYAGGGITSKSSPKVEWKETELKSQMILEYFSEE